MNIRIFHIELLKKKTHFPRDLYSQSAKWEWENLAFLHRNGAMDGGVCHLSDTVTNGSSEQLPTLSLDCHKVQQISDKLEKNPRLIARKYQMDLCKKALKENVIVYLGTGCGKTNIAVLLIYEMGHLIKKPQKNICVFLAPTVALVQQQAKVIEKSVDFKVGIYCESSAHLKGRCNWEKEIKDHEILVMTPQILLHNLSNCFIKIEMIALLIFDECHYAQLESHHPYSEIMQIFYKVDVAKLPRIFGMTASPKLGKGGSIDSLEALLHAKVYSVDDEDELEQFVTSPKVNVYYYGSIENGYSCPYTLYTRKIEEIKHLCMSELRLNTLDQRLRSSTKKLLQNLHSSIIFCLENLGLWGALQASYIFLKGDHSEHIEEIEAGRNCSDDNLCKNYLQKIASVLASDRMEDGMDADLSCLEVLREPFISRKLSQLIEILSNFRLQENMKCVIFVNRIIIARSLSYILRNLKPLVSWKCDFLVGVHSKLVSRKNTNIILEKFRSGEINLLVATKVGEEGLDIQTCCLVIRFDLPETVSSFIQSRDHARMPQSEYAFLVDRGNPRELNLVKHFKKDEAQMNEEISFQKSPMPIAITGLEERTHKVDITGATISSVFSISLLHRYCSRLPHDEFFIPKPQFFYYDDVDGMVCNIILPANAPIRQIISAPQPSTDAAKRDACLKACKALHEVGALTEYLLLEQVNKHEEWTQDLSDSDSCNITADEESRVELHKMLVPAAFREPWTEIGNSTCLSSYYIEFCPNPVDRIYKRFGLFVKKPLPEEAAKIKLDLCLAHGRMVMTRLIPSGVSRFNEDEIASAERFQRMFLKVILDRYKFVLEYVSLDDDDVYESRSSTFYLLLPVIQQESDKISVDWMLVRRCLSSPIFRHPSNCLGNRVSQLNSGLHLANGHRSLNDIVNSLVYVPCKQTFFFISDIFPEKNGFSSYDDSKNHVEHYTETFDIHLAYPDQPLLKAKQLFILENLLRKKGLSGQWREKEEHFVELPPEICQLKIIGFSKDIGNSVSLLPSMMHRLGNFLVALELKEKLFAAFPEGAEVTTDRILEALTTERCCEQFSLERLEVLGDAFLKFAVGSHLFLKYDALDEGQLTKKRSDIVSSSNLLKLATRNNLQGYIRDQSFDPNQFFAFGHPCPVTCKKETETRIHSRCNGKTNHAIAEVRCDKCHQWLHKKTIVDVVEALTGAFIVDSGFKAAIAFLKWIGIQVDFIPSQIDNICSGSSSFLPLANHMELNSLENLLGYKFVHKGLLIQAFVHPSYNNHLGGCHQRLEFLGDAVLDYLITSYLYSVYPNLKPGYLTDLRSVSVNNISFSNIAGRCSFHKFIICDSTVLCETMAKYVGSIGSPESFRGHIGEKTCPKVLGDFVESFVGALFLDAGFDLNHVWKIMLSLLDPIISFSKLQLNPLKELRELCQFYNWELQFSSSKEDGKFSVEAKIDEKTVSATACATSISRKTAIRIAASQVYECLKAQGYKSKSKSLEEVLKKSEKRKAKLIGFDEMTTSNYDLFSSPIRQAHFPHNWCNADPQGTGVPCTGLAKTFLYEICVANCWKPPIFECFKETGPCHLKEFIYKVVLEIEEVPNETFEFYGEPRTRKKEAAEHAAQGALWYLKHEGYLLNKKQNR